MNYLLTAFALRGLVRINRARIPVNHLHVVHSDTSTTGASGTNLNATIEPATATTDAAIEPIVEAIEASITP